MKMEDMVLVSVDDHITEPGTVFDNQLSGEDYATAPKLKVKKAGEQLLGIPRQEDPVGGAERGDRAHPRGIRHGADQPRSIAQGLLGRRCADR